MPKWFKSFTVTRVSSAAMKSTAASVSAARGEKSERLPIGVPTTYSAAFSSLFSIFSPFLTGAAVRGPVPRRARYVFPVL